MIKNFHIEQGVELVQDGSVYDLHNDYGLRCIMTGAKREILMLFSSAVDGREIALRFLDVSVLSISPSVVLPSEMYVDEIGYKAADDYDDEWLMNESQKGGGDHMIFRFEKSGSIRIYCRECNLNGGEQQDTKEYINQWLAML